MNALVLAIEPLQSIVVPRQEWFVNACLCRGLIQFRSPEMAYLLNRCIAVPTSTCIALPKEGENAGRMDRWMDGWFDQ